MDSITQLIDHEGRLWSGNPLTITRDDLQPRSRVFNNLAISKNGELMNVNTGEILITSGVSQIVGIDEVTYVRMNDDNLMVIHNDVQFKVGTGIKRILTDFSGKFIILIDSNSNYLSTKFSNYEFLNMPRWESIIMNHDGIIVTTSIILTLDVNLNEVNSYPTPIGLVDITRYDHRLLGLTSNGSLIIIGDENRELNDIVVNSINERSRFRGFLHSNGVVLIYCEDGSIYQLARNQVQFKYLKLNDKI
jgi:hypothetical protein